MTIDLGEVSDDILSVSRLHAVKKHQYDLLVDECKKACRNNHDTIVWLGSEITLQLAHYLVEYLNTKFKDMK